MGNSRKGQQAKQGTTPGRHVNEVVDPRKQLPPGPRPDESSLVGSKGALLDAALNGWGTTIRYALLLCIRRTTSSAAIWIAIELIRHSR
jgi:hypothetical protein